MSEQEITEFAEVHAAVEECLALAEQLKKWEYNSAVCHNIPPTAVYVKVEMVFNAIDAPEHHTPLGRWKLYKDAFFILHDPTCR